MNNKSELLTETKDFKRAFDLVESIHEEYLAKKKSKLKGEILVSFRPSKKRRDMVHQILFRGNDKEELVFVKEMVKNENDINY